MTVKSQDFALRGVLLTCIVVGSAGMGEDATAQEVAARQQGGRLLTVEPRLSVSEGYTSNLKLASDSQDAALITTLAPGLAIRARGLELIGALDYAANGLYYMKSPEPDRVNHQLNSQLRWSPSDGSAFVQASATLSQQNVSALGPISVDPSLANPNARQFANASVMPGVRLHIGDAALLESQINWVASRAKGTDLGDQSGYAAGAVLRPAHSGGLVHLQLMADVQSSKPRVGRRVASDRLIGSLTYQPDPDWKAGFNLGTDANNFTAEDKVRKAAYGVQVSWRPSPRTSAEFAADRRSYGSTHSLAFEYRMARLALRVADIQQVSPPGAQSGLGSRTNFDLLFQMLASLEPDPEKRKALVLATLQASGLSPDAVSTPGFLTSAVNLSRVRQVSVLWAGVRTSLSLSLAHSSNTRLGAVTVPGDDLGLGDRILQQGSVFTLSHKLSPMSTLSFGYTNQRTHTSLSTVGDSRLRSLSGALNIRLAQSRSLSFNVRRAEMDSTFRPYVENAVSGTLQQLF